MRLGRFHYESVVDARDPRSTARSVLRGLTLSPCFDCPSQGDDVVVECKVPLIGGKIADLVAGDTRRALEHEQAWVNEYLDS